jgi:hypothetical protein
MRRKVIIQKTYFYEELEEVFDYFPKVMCEHNFRGF